MNWEIRDPVTGAVKGIIKKSTDLSDNGCAFGLVAIIALICFVLPLMVGVLLVWGWIKTIVYLFKKPIPTAIYFLIAALGLYLIYLFCLVPDPVQGGLMWSGA